MPTMDTINVALLDRLRRAADLERSLSVGLAQQIIEATRYHSVLAAQAHEAARAAERFPHEAAPAGMSTEEWAERLNTRELQRAEDERRMRAFARDPAVRNVEQFAAEFALHRHPDAAHFHAAAVAAAEAVQRAGVALQQLEEERAQHGRRGARLRQSIHEAETWLAGQGLTVEETA